jgi:hypothetical protein
LGQLDEGTPGDLPMIANVVNSTDNQGLVMADSFFDDGGGNLQLSLQAWPGRVLHRRVISALMARHCTSTTEIGIMWRPRLTC